MSRNIANLDNETLREGLDQLRRRLPVGWVVDRLPATSRQLPSQADDWVTVTAPDGRRASLAVEVRRQMDPRTALDLISRVTDPSTPLLLVARYLTAGVRERLREANVGYADLTGNVRLAISDPGLFVEASGAAMDPNREDRPARSLKGPKAGRVVRALCDFKDVGGVRELAGRAGVDPGYVSRLLAMLDREAIIERRQWGSVSRSRSGPRTASSSGSASGPRTASSSGSASGPRTASSSGSASGPIGVDWARLLRRWAEDAPLESRGATVTCIDPRGLSALLKRLSTSRVRHAVTGSLAASTIAPIAPPRLATLYVTDLGLAMDRLALEETTAGANAQLISPIDDVAFERTSERDGVTYAAPSQVAADLLTGPGRSPAEAEALLEWMAANEEAWRG